MSVYLKMRTEIPFLLYFLIGCMLTEKCEYALFWDIDTCRQCSQLYEKKPGYEFTLNCGKDDEGGELELPYKPCNEGMYNNGTFIRCKDCTPCPPGQKILEVCSATMDTKCGKNGEEAVDRTSHLPETTPFNVLLMRHTENTVTPSTQTTQLTPNAVILIPSPDQRHFQATWIVLAATTALTAFIIYVLRRKRRKEEFQSRAAHQKKVFFTVSQKGFLPPSRMTEPTVSEDIRLSSTYKEQKIDDILDPKIQKAPLQSVLDNLDVLEELIMLLDPECSVARTTRHVAARCSFPATWINYTYSMRDTKSPLKAVLEGVTTRFPEWTVGDLARVFNDIGRNDAVAVLGKLPVLESPANTLHI